MPKIKVEIVRNVKMPKIKVELEVPDEYCDKAGNVCPMCVDDGVATYCIAFNYALEEEDFHCKRLKACKKAENQEEAEQKVIDAYYNGKFVLDAADFVDVNFETREGDLAERLSPADQLNLTYVE